MEKTRNKMLKKISIQTAYRGGGGVRYGEYVPMAFVSFGHLQVQRSNGQSWWVGVSRGCFCEGQDGGHYDGMSLKRDVMLLTVLRTYRRRLWPRHGASDVDYNIGDAESAVTVGGATWAAALDHWAEKSENRRTATECTAAAA